MAENSKIEWTDHTFNPWWGCEKVSPACANCYAEAFAKRTGNNVWGRKSDRRFFGDKHWNEPLKWDARAKAEGVRRRVFCASMADVFEDRMDLDAQRNRLWDLIDATPNLDWLLLTKRPERIRFSIPGDWMDDPRPNVWYGTTVESAEYESRILALHDTPGLVRFVSCEPLLGRIDLCSLREMDWVIVGGESGPKKRPLNLDHAREIRDYCLENTIAFFMKQVDKIQPVPDDLMIRQFPQPTTYQGNHSDEN